ncbi:hypothetical protein BHM03_00030757 [Ensete ventricosum]|nr:hypothetical protein BHM03_00030757 [Ensete ventricosum]
MSNILLSNGIYMRDRYSDAPSIAPRNSHNSCVKDEGGRRIGGGDQRFARKFVKSSPIGYRELVGRCWEFAKGDRELAGGSPESYRELARSSPKDQLMTGKQRLCVVIVCLNYRS